MIAVEKLQNPICQGASIEYSTLYTRALHSERQQGLIQWNPLSDC